MRPDLAVHALLALAFAASTLAAQEPVTVTGVVVDEASGRPLPGVMASIAAEDWGVMTGDDGRFSLPDVPRGQVRLAFQQLGYVDQYVTTVVGSGMAPLRVELQPQPFVLEGIEVMADRFERRRNATPASVRAFDRDDLRFVPYDLLDFLRNRALVQFTRCPDLADGFNCINWRGRRVSPTVYVDEFRQIAGLDFLEGLPSSMIYLVEVYRNGRQIRVYTNQYMERAGRIRPVAVPLWW